MRDNMPKYDYFVAHKFSNQEKDDLREAIENAFKGKNLNPYYADIEVRESETHILDKIIEKLRETRFSIFDITDGNSNVFLELGLAKGLGRTFFIICHKKSVDYIPSGLKGLDRIDFGSYKELTENIKKIILPQVLEMQKTIVNPKESLSQKDIRLVDHYKLLLDKNLRFRTKTYIGFADYEKCDLRIQIISLNFPPPPEYDMYSKEVDAHIESGYENLLKIIKKREFLISEHDAKAKQFLNNLKSKVMNELKERIPNIIEWNGIGQPPIKYFLKYLLFEVGCIVQFFYERTIDIDQYFKVEQANNRWQIRANNALIVSDNETELKEITQKIKATLDNAIKSEDFKILKKYFEEVNNQHQLFKKEINQIIKDVESGSLLKGHCDISICRNS